MTGKEALKNIAVEFDTMGMICSNIVYKDFWEKDLRFKEIFGCEYKIIMKDLKRLENIKEIFEDMKDARDNASFLQDDEEFLTIFIELSHWCEQLKEVFESVGDDCE